MQKECPNLYLIKSKIESLKSKFDNYEFHVPSLWINPDSKEVNSVKICPISYFLNKIEEIDKLSESYEDKSAQKPLEDSIIYNSFVRLNTAFDYTRFSTNQDQMEFPFRVSGTFLKTLALIPYYKSLGTDILYLLPITKIGKSGRKGNLGSPYAIQNHFEFDENLSEPFLDLPVEVQFAALVEVCHLAGIKVVLEFVLRTASLDSDLIPEHPDWFYWIKSNNEGAFHPPAFEDDVITALKEKIERKDFSDLPSPTEDYKGKFLPSPNKVIKRGDSYIGLYKDGTEGIVPNAFADWPPDDNQPLWSDVTYFKMFSHPDYNYMAYNTIRMYDDELNQEKYANTELWEYLENVIPHYIEKFGIDGIMLDMGHALPDLLLKRIIGRIRAEKPDFLLFEENFNITAESKEIGYDAVAGYIPFDMHRPEKLYEIFKRYEAKDFPINFFGTAENHNTPRAASRFNDINYPKMTYLINRLFPAITFIHNGFELGELKPVNTGLDFTDEEIEKYKPEELPLFSYSELNWLNKENIIDFIKEVNKLKDKSDLSELKIEKTEEGLLVKYGEFNCILKGEK